MRVVHLLSTYNEKENIGKMIDFLLDQAKTLPEYEYVILVADSHSPDGTGQIVKEYSEKNKNIHLLETPRGLGVSLIAGYKYAVDELKADIVIPNDVDFQWDPALIPQMLAKIKEGYDVVVPSRHVAGGNDNFSTFRKITHFFSNTLFNYYWAGIHEVHDLAGNFKAIKVKGFLDKVDFERLNVKGFVIQATIIYELSKTGAKFTEIPAIFGERKAGVTKVGLNVQFVKDVFETVKNSTRIRFERSPKLFKFFKFGIVGGFGFVINFVGLIIFNGLLKAILPWPIGVINFLANSMASEISIISNFTWNNVWTFSKETIKSPKELLSKFIAFNLSSIVGGMLVPSGIIGLGTQLFGDQYRSIFLILAVFGFTIPYNWFIYNKFIWKNKK
jgi:dolichol-phosphate mannosyltransferase